MRSFNSLLSVWKSDETLYLMFDILYQELCGMSSGSNTACITIKGSKYYYCLTTCLLNEFVLQYVAN